MNNACNVVWDMEKIVFSVKNSFDYHWSGRFIAPNENWIHMTRELSDYELVLVTEGKLYIECDGKEYLVKEGEYLLMPPCKVQKGTRQGYCSFYWLHFSVENNNGQTAQRIDERTENSEKMLPRKNKEEENQEVEKSTIVIKAQGNCVFKERLIILLKELQDSDRRYRNQELNNFLTGAILSEIALQLDMDRRPKNTISGEQLNLDIKTYISWHISENLKIDELAAYFEYNEKYLTTFFKKMNGLPLKQYILTQKMEYAKSILTESNNTVSEVAYSIGFADVHNFSNAFKKIVGMSPGTYRQQYNQHSIFDK